MKTTLFLPVLNEIDGLKAILPRIRREWVDEMIFVDGGSTDGTLEYLEENGYHVIRQKEKGLAAAYWECFGVATGDVIIPFSPDNNSVPELLPQLVGKMREGYDLVIVSRYRDGARSEDDDPVTAFGNWMFTTMVNVLFGGRYTDVLVMYRAFRKDLIERLKLDVRKTPVLEVQLVIRCLKHGCKVGEIPGDEPKRIGGKRKMSVWYNGSTILWLILKELFGRRVKKKATPAAIGATPLPAQSATS
jgi:glycosyltransferase involved in cell wall biosynthesis